MLPTSGVAARPAQPSATIAADVARQLPRQPGDEPPADRQGDTHQRQAAQV